MPSLSSLLLPLFVAAGLSSSASAAVTCWPGVNIFAARGTFESPPDSFGLSGVHINAIKAAVPGSNATVIQYPATFSNDSVIIGVVNGTNEITSYLDACPTSKIVLMGYSQGADVVGYILTGGNFSVGTTGSAQNLTVEPLASKYADQVSAIVLFGDPQYNINVGINSDAPFPCNVSSDSPRLGSIWESYGPRLEEWCNHDDLFCCATGHTLAGHLSYFSEGNATITADFVTKQLGLSSSNSSTSSTADSSQTGAATSSQASPNAAVRRSNVWF